MNDPIRVLHVDGDPELADVAADRLQQEDERFFVDTAPGPDEALESCDLSDVDCILSDYDIPDSDGIEFLETVREADPDLPFILFTTRGSEEIASRAISAGVTDYVRRGDDPGQYADLADRITTSVERYRSRRDVESTARKLSELVEHTDDILFLFDGDWSELLFVNSAYEDAWGGSIEELERDPSAFVDHVHPKDREKATRSIDRITQGDSDTVEYRIIRPDGEQRWVRGKTTPILDEEGNVERIAGYVRDITEQRDRAAEVREKSNLLDQLFKQVPIHMYVKDTEARHLRVSQHHTDDPDEYLGRTDSEIFPGRFGEEAYADDMFVIETEEPIVDKEEYLPTRDAWHLTSKVPWYGGDGEIRGLIGVTKGITERKQYQRELERQNDRLDEFAKVVSHDLRNPLNVAEGRLDLAQAECDSAHLDDVATAHERMEALIENLLSLAREGEEVSEVTPVELDECASRCWDAVDTEDARIEILTDLTVQADRTRLRQLFENLFRNAVEHGGADVTITIGEIEDGFYVADDGPGISSEDRDRVFETGFSTTTDGTGFGLAIVSEIAKAHDWEISATGSENGGARFEISGVDTGT